MPSNVRLFNQAASSFTDNFRVFDNNASGAAIATFVVQGQDNSPPFNCAADDQGYGDLQITNLTNNSSFHVDFVRDDQLINA